MVSFQAAPVPARAATHSGDIWPDERPFTAIWVLLFARRVHWSSRRSQYRWQGKGQRMRPG